MGGCVGVAWHPEQQLHSTWSQSTTKFSSFKSQISLGTAPTKLFPNYRKPNTIALGRNQVLPKPYNPESARYLLDRDSSDLSVNLIGKESYPKTNYHSTRLLRDSSWWVIFIGFLIRFVFLHLFRFLLGYWLRYHVLEWRCPSVLVAIYLLLPLIPEKEKDAVCW